MAEGGGIKNIWNGLAHGVKRLWVGAHRDQRLSWIGHWFVCAAASSVFALAGLIDTGLTAQLGYLIGAFCALVFFLLRETGDEDYHRNVAKDWDTLDADQNLAGAERRMVTPRGDKIGDLTGPMFNFGTAALMWLWGL